MSNTSIDREDLEQKPNNPTPASIPTKGTQLIFRDPITRLQPKRKQVSRACDWCRTFRIKCDSRYPCKNCQVKGRACNVRNSITARNPIEITSRVESLQSRIKDLEKQVEVARSRTQVDYNDAALVQSPTVKYEQSPSLYSQLDPLQGDSASRNLRHLECVHVRATSTQEQHCYGRASSLFFIARLSSRLGVELQRLTQDGLMKLDIDTRSNTNAAAGGQVPGQSLPSDVSIAETYLSRAQEEYFLHLFWPSYNVYYPIIEHAQFQDHYQSLWTSQTHRKPSALADILLALSMQYADALMPRDYTALRTSMESIANIDAAIAGRKFYRRCQLLLTDELESPSTTTLQCHFFSVIYLSNASCHNAAHSQLALAVRTGIVLGLHWGPSKNVPDKQAESRRRIWWTVYALELKMALDLGRPLGVNMSQIPCPPPEHHQDDPFTHQGTNRFTANKHFIQLMLAGRSVSITFHNKCTEVLSHTRGDHIYNDPLALETVAEAVASAIAQHLHTWQKEIPEPLKTKRLNSGEPFSTDRSALNLKESIPLGMSRQRLFLEILFHNLCMNFYRSFMYFTHHGNTPLADTNAIYSVNHAITITNIVHQVLKESNFLAGFHETFQWQWNATITLIGFIVAFPSGSLTVSARDSLITAIDVFDIIGKYLGIACSASRVARELFAKVEHLISLSSPVDINNYNHTNITGAAGSFVDLGLPTPSHQSLPSDTLTFGGSEHPYMMAGNFSNTWGVEQHAEFASSWVICPDEGECVNTGMQGGFEFAA